MTAVPAAGGKGGSRVLRSVSLPELARKEIESMILSGEIKSGDRINENALAARFGISRGPLREAIGRLEQSGLVETIANRGAFIRRIDRADVLEIYEIRAALERAGARTACRKADPSDLSRLRAIVARMDEAQAAGDHHSYFDANLAFHTCIHNLSGNSRLKRLYEQLSRELTLFRHRSIITSGIGPSNDEHHAILDAFMHRDEAAAAEAMEGHVLAAADRVRSALDSSLLHAG